MAAWKGSMVLLLMIACLFHGASAAIHTVGDSAGWTTPQDVTFYDDWALKQNFVVGDKLAFVSTTNHNVYEVSAIDADHCDSSNPLDFFLSASPTVTLSTAGTHAFICAKPGHCVLGMKMIVDVVTVPRMTNETAFAPPSPDSPSPDAAPKGMASPPPSSASSLRSTTALVVVPALALIACTLGFVR